MSTSGPIDILLIEDDPVNAIVMKSILNDTDLKFRLHHVEDGEEALHFVQRNCQVFNTRFNTCPDLIVLDLNLPKESETEILGEIKQDPALLRIPVVVLSTSGEGKEVQEEYSLHANCYVKQPTKYAELEAAVKFIQELWTNPMDKK